MPQLDLFTMQSQIICLIVSLFFIYNFLLKYAISSYDAFSRIKIKKLNFFHIQNSVLCFFSISLKKKTIEYSNYITDNIFDFTKILDKNFMFHFNFLYDNLKINKLFYIKLKRKIKKNFKYVTLRKVLVKKIFLNKTKFYLISKLGNILLTLNDSKYKKIIKYLIKRTNLEKNNLIRLFYKKFKFFVRIYLASYIRKLLKKIKKYKKYKNKYNFTI